MRIWNGNQLGEYAPQRAEHEATGSPGLQVVQYECGSYSYLMATDNQDF